MAHGVHRLLHYRVIAFKLC